jgi:hypothetical protein
VKEAARRFGQQVDVVSVASKADLNAAFAMLVQRNAGALLVASDSLFLSLSEQIVALAAHHKIPTIYSQREPVLVGGLMSYAAKVETGYHQGGIYVARILKGAKPGDLPVVQPTNFDLLINLKTAETLGLEIPPKLLALADEARVHHAARRRGHQSRFAQATAPASVMHSHSRVASISRYTANGRQYPPSSLFTRRPDLPKKGCKVCIRSVWAFGLREPVNGISPK